MTREEFFKLLVDTSANNGFPAQNDEATQCVYLAGDGRRCAIGMLLPKEEARRLNCVGAVDEVNWPEFVPFVPEWLQRDTAIEIQVAHDSFGMRYRNSGKWDHKGFVAELKLIPVFSDL